MAVNMDRVLTVAERIIGYAITDHGLEAVRAEVQKRPSFLSLLSQLAGNTPAPPSSKTTPFSTRGNQILLNGEPFKFTGANMRGLAWYGDILQYARPEFVPVQLDGAKALGMRVIRFYAAHRDRTVGQSIARTKAVLDQLAARGMYGIVVLTDGAQSGFDVKDTPNNRGGAPDRYTQAWVDGGFRENFKPFVDAMTGSPLLANHPAIFSWEIINEYTATIFPLTIQQADNLLGLFDEISTLISSNSPNTLITPGSESNWQLFVNHAYDGGQYGKKLYNLSNIHVGTVHTYRSDNPLGSAGDHVAREMALTDIPLIIEETNTYHTETTTDWYDRLVAAAFPRMSGMLQWNMSFPYCIDTGDVDGLWNCDRTAFNGARWHNHTGFWRAFADRLRLFA